MTCIAFFCSQHSIFWIDFMSNVRCCFFYSKYHEMKEKHKLKLCRAKQKFDDETAWRDEKINNLERELSLCSHSLAKVNPQLSPTVHKRNQDVCKGEVHH